MGSFERRYSSHHSPDDVWRVLNTSLSREVAQTVYPGVDVSYEGLSDEGHIQRGTHVIYVPDRALANKVPPVARRFVPKVINLLVQEQEPEDRTRLDVVEAVGVSGVVRTSVESAGEGGSLLAIEGELSIERLQSLFESMVANVGIDKLSRHTLDNVPLILGS